MYKYKCDSDAWFNKNTGKQEESMRWYSYTKKVADKIACYNKLKCFSEKASYAQFIEVAQLLLWTKIKQRK